MPLARKELNIWPTKQGVAVRKIFAVKSTKEKNDKIGKNFQLVVLFALIEILLMMKFYDDDDGNINLIKL